MPPRKIANRLIVIVSAAVFAVFAQQAGADQNLHCCALRFSDTEFFTYSTTLLGIEKEDSAFSYPHTGRSAVIFSNVQMSVPCCRGRANHCFRPDRCANIHRDRAVHILWQALLPGVFGQAVSDKSPKSEACCFQS